jgi:DNA-binding transcriptional LysR family regulator
VLFAQLDAAESDIARFKGQAGGLVKVAAFPSAAAAFLPHAWSSVAAASTQVQVEFEEMEPEESLAALLNHEIDIAIAHAYDLLPRPLGVAFDVRTLLDEPVLLAVSTLDQPLTGSIDLSSVAQQPFIVPRDGTSCAEMVQRACARAGFVPQVAARATDFAVQLELVAAGLGVALVPNLATRRVPHGVRLLRPLEPITRNIFTVSVRGGYGKPAVRVVVDALEAAAKHGHRREQLLT